MRDRLALKFSPETMALEGRTLLTSVTKLPFSDRAPIFLNNKGVLVGQLSNPG